MHVQHSEQTARDQSTISQLPTDSAQVALNVESMPEQAIVNSTTHDAAQLADSLCSGGGEAQQTRQPASGHTVGTVNPKLHSSRDWGGD